MAPFRVPLLLTALAAGAAAQTQQALAPVRVLALKARTAHVQGIDTDGVHLWVTSVERDTRKGYLQEFAVADGRLERSVEVQDGARFHAGGIAADADSIWIPVA